jgi:soluble lytic murein transglycosylase-like protein
MRRFLYMALLLLSGARCSYTHAAEVPTTALKYRADLIRNARVIWGMDAPVATFAAQVHQESGWRSDVISPVGAQGLTQFMPTTATWIAGLYPQSVGSAQPFNPSWAMRALVQYDRWLYDRIRAADACERLAFALSAYNGGLGWVNRDKRLASSKGLDPLAWFGSVELVNDGRSTANWQQNRAYPQRILRKYEALYVAAHWGRGACHD